ncbi:MAG: hypothetical protein Q9221_009163 [Calogaya cf. arnoldii]
MDAPQNCTRLPTLRKALSNLPKSLDETYSRMLCNVPEESIDDAFKMLQWMIASREPLLLEELAEVVAINIDGDLWFEPEARFPEPSEVLLILSSLVTVEPIPWKYSIKTQRVRFAHYSVKEYLISDRILNYGGKGLAIQEDVAAKYIVEATCAYLLHLGFCDAEKGWWENVPDHPLIAYASVHWVDHLLLLDKEKIPYELVLKLLLKFQALQTVNSHVLHQFNSRSRPECHLDHPLGFAAWAGLPKLVRMLLEEGHDIDHQTRWGADVHIRGGYYSTGLQEACYKGQEYHVRLSLRAGANVNVVGGLYGTVLQAAAAGYASSQKVCIVKMLLEAGADVNLQGGIFCTALQAAVARTSYFPNEKNYDYQIIQLLLAKKPQVNIQGGEYGSALLAAASRYWVEVFELLLMEGATVTARELQHLTFGNWFPTGIDPKECSARIRGLLEEALALHSGTITDGVVSAGTSGQAVIE